LHHETLSRISRSDDVKLSQTLKDQSASSERYRYRLEGNGHPWPNPRRFEAKVR